MKLLLVLLALLLPACAANEPLPADEGFSQGAPRAASRGSAAPASRAGSGPAAEELPLPELFLRAAPAVVFLEAMSIRPAAHPERVERVMGSGFVFDPRGLVLTNSHVAYGRQAITATLEDGRRLPARLVGADPLLDLAVLRVELREQEALPAIPFGDSDAVRVGDAVAALGNPLGLEQSLTRGIVSSVDRVLPEAGLPMDVPMIQTDAAIHPGSSGGPLLNLRGEVIGITAAILRDAPAIGFAIPINLARAVIPTLLQHGRIVRPWLGFHGQLVDDLLKDLIKVPLADGLLIETIEPGSPAEKAGLKAGELEVVLDGSAYLLGGDVVVEINRIALDSPERLTEALRGLKVGDKVRLRVIREGEERTFEYALPERPVLPGDVRERGASTARRRRR